MNRKVMILAAGRGSRMHHLTNNTPKPLLEIAGKPLIVYHIEQCARLQMRDIVINISHLSEQIKTFLGKGDHWGVNIQYSEEVDSPLEVAGGIQHAQSMLGESPFIAINADIWTDYPLQHLPITPRGLAHLVLVDNPAHNKRGDFCLEPDQSVQMKEGENPFTFSGIALYHPNFFKQNTQKISYLKPLLDQAIIEGQVTGEHYQGRWLDIGTPERLAEARKQARSAY